MILKKTCVIMIMGFLKLKMCEVVMLSEKKIGCCGCFWGYWFCFCKEYCDGIVWDDVSES